MTCLRRQSKSLCEQPDLEESRRQEIQQCVREAEEQWKTALHTAEQTLNKAETRRAQLDKDFNAFKAQNEDIQLWIRDQQQNLRSLDACVQVEEKPQIAQVSLTYSWISCLVCAGLYFLEFFYKGLLFKDRDEVPYLFSSGDSELKA